MPERFRPLHWSMVVLLITLCPSSLWANGWKRLSTEDGVVVEVREQEGRNLPDFRGTAVVQAPLYEVAAVVQDVDRACEWTARCKGSRVLKRLGDVEMLFYSRTDAPWPVADRDAVLDARGTGMDEGVDVTVTFARTESPLMPPVDGVVRMPTLRGHYRLVRIDDRSTKVEFQVAAHPGGMIPDWLANRLARDIPYDTLTGLRKQVGRMRGKYPAFVEKWTARQRAARTNPQVPAAPAPQ